MTMIEVKTADLAGPALDYAVATAEGMYIHTPPGLKFEYWYKDGRCLCSRSGWGPSTCWSQAGPLVEKYAVKLVMLDDCQDGVEPKWAAEAGAECTWESNPNVHMATNGGEGPTPLVAACRAIVRAKSGDTVRVPKELMP